MVSQETNNIKEVELTTNHLNNIPLSVISSFVDRLAELYHQHQDVASVCQSLTSHYEQEDSCKRKVQLLEAIRIEADSHMETIKNNMFIEVRSIMREFKKSQQ